MGILVKVQLSQSLLAISILMDVNQKANKMFTVKQTRQPTSHFVGFLIDVRQNASS